MYMYRPNLIYQLVWFRFGSYVIVGLFAIWGFHFSVIKHVHLHTIKLAQVVINIAIA